MTDQRTLTPISWFHPWTQIYKAPPLLPCQPKVRGHLPLLKNKFPPRTHISDLLKPPPLSLDQPKVRGPSVWWILRDPDVGCPPVWGAFAQGSLKVQPIVTPRKVHQSGGLQPGGILGSARSSSHKRAAHACDFGGPVRNMNIHLENKHVPWFVSPGRVCFRCREDCITIPRVLRHHNKQGCQLVHEAGYQLWAGWMMGPIQKVVAYFKLDTLDGLLSKVCRTDCTPLVIPASLPLEQASPCKHGPSGRDERCAQSIACPPPLQM